MANIHTYQFTREGYENLKKEYEELLAQRPGVLERMVMAREQGDLSENAGFHAAKERLGAIDFRLRELKLLMRLGQIVEGTKQSTVGFGNRVTIENIGEKREFLIVSAMEADPAKNKVSQVSPIGSALLGKKVGDTVEIEIPEGKVVFKIVAIC